MDYVLEIEQRLFKPNVHKIKTLEKLTKDLRPSEMAFLYAISAWFSRRGNTSSPYDNDNDNSLYALTPLAQLLFSYVQTG